ncbi:MAG: hypothetical protein CMD65_00920 [Gammaproteobacteria bacterium]|nr:hypothetical protein [Gammaproteobacteria bacterium]|tara:strand:+ start:5544 stop:6272 length:729 start_codon:yes stop_codon:yes gene_type:complete
MNVIILSKLSIAEKLTQEFERKNIKSVYLPLIETISAKISQKQINGVKNADKIIFQSRNAVRHAQQLLPVIKNHDNLSCLSVGKFTACEVKKLFGVISEYPKNNFSSESLLNIKSLESISNKKIVVVRGIGGRKLIENTIKSRHAEVSVIESYERKIIKNNLKKIKLDKNCKNFIIALSKFAIDEFFKEFNDYISKYHIIIVVPSDRIIEKMIMNHSVSIIKVNNLESEKSYIECIVNDNNK